MKKIIFLIILTSFFLTENIFSQELMQGKCPANLILTQNLKAPSFNEPFIRNGRYNSYTEGIVSEAHILQKHLNRLNFNAGWEDGIIGPKTRAAIKRLQIFLETIPDGYVGPKTRALLNYSCGEKIVNNLFPEKKVSSEEISSILSRGVNDKTAFGEVSKLQNFLKSKGYKISVDGDFGYGTEKVLKEFTKKELDFEMDYFDPRLFQEDKEWTEKNYNPKKINEYLGYGKFDFFYLNFPFTEDKINSIYCGKAKKDYIFKNNKIIFPISKNGPGKFTCTLNANLDGRDNIFEIVDVYFRTVKRPSTKVNLIKKYATGPTTNAQKRIASERKMLKEIYIKADKEVKFNSSFINPLETKKLSPFGKVRIFNDGRRSVHSGTDFKAQNPLPVKAVNDGKVILANFDLYYCGKGIVINHGMNIYSTYCHLSENKVSVGDKVSRGQIIGLTGSTGRVSGPHLHLSTKYNGGYIDFEELQKVSEISFK